MLFRFPSEEEIYEKLEAAGFGPFCGTLYRPRESLLRYAGCSPSIIMTAMVRYRFSEFILSPRRRMLLRNGREQPLIPRYFDLLVFLVEHRSEAVHRRDIFDRVWSDVVVSDSALSQAIRTIRRVLGDDSRAPRFVRTISRHGYRFVFEDVAEEVDDGEWQAAAAATPCEPDPRHGAATDSFESLLQRLTNVATNPGEEEEQREPLGIP